jgi:hypothetical protein
MFCIDSSNTKAQPPRGIAKQIIEAMNSSVKTLLFWFALGAVVLGFVTATATTVLPPTFEEMTDRAELIFVGKVVRSRAEWRTVGGKRVIFTLVEFERQEVLKGKASDSVILEFLGGTLGDATLEVDGVPKFNTGDRELLFVAGNGVRFCPLVGVFHGKLGVRQDHQSGREILMKHDGKELRDVAEIGAGADLAPKRGKVSILATAEPLSLTDIKAKILERVAKDASRK